MFPPIEGYNPTAAELMHNIGIMKKASDEGKIIDPVFLDIFRSATAQLPQKEQTGINRKIDAVGVRLTRNFNNNFKRVDSTAQQAYAPHIRPLVAEETSLEEMIHEYKKGNVKAGLEEISNHYDCRRISGDGHCLFRSVATGYLLSFPNLTREQKIATIQNIDAHINEITGGDPTHPLHALKQPFFAALEQITPANADAVVRDEGLSNRLVAFLRLLAAQHNEAFPSDTLDALLAMENIRSEDYFRGMADMKNRWEGGEPELHAMAECLDAAIYAHDASLAADKSLEYIRPYSNNDNNHIEIDLLYRPGHYDLLIEKPEATS